MTKDPNVGYLVLTRAIGQKIFIGDNIVITVIGRHGDGMRLGFEAPKETTILRGELLDDHDA